jgi:hypothetical protein
VIPGQEKVVLKTGGGHPLKVNGISISIVNFGLQKER